MSYRISYIRAAGWTRLGVAAGVCAASASPMLWALGSFGASDEALHRAIIFAVAGLWCFIATGLALGWAIQGFVIRQKAAEEDSDAPPAASSHRPPPSPPPSGRPAHPSKSGGH